MDYNIKNNCPRCEGKVIRVWHERKYGVGGYFCRCSVCGFSQRENFSEIEGAVDNWNKMGNILRLYSYNMDDISEFLSSEGLPHLIDSTRRLMSDESMHVYAIYCRGRIVSMCALSIVSVFPSEDLLNGKMGYISGMHTRLDRRRKGYASKLLDYVIEQAKESKVDYLSCDSLCDGLYIKRGFVNAPETGVRLWKKIGV